MPTFLDDAAHYPGGHADGVALPADEDAVVASLREARTVLPIGAQSSLTGGATPMGERVLSTSRMRRILRATGSTLTVQAGVTIAEMQAHLGADGAWFPPAPTFTGACAGGIVATNAAGAATFKYGSTRDWVQGLTVVLADGTVVRLARGEQRADGGYLEIAGLRVPVPTYSMPQVAKCSAGYFAAPAMDAVDLFIGSEGTLGVITEITFRILRPGPAQALALIPCRSDDEGFGLAAALRDAARQTWRTRDRRGIDVAAIEYADARSLSILREDAAFERYDVSLPATASCLLFVQLDLAAGTTAETAYAEIGAALESAAPDTPLTRFCRLLDEHDLLNVTELAMPGDHRRAEQIAAIREAVPAGVNSRVARAKAQDDRISKTAADMVVPFERLREMDAIYRGGFAARGLDFAIWGHLSDGNVHPNVIPRSYRDVEQGREAILEFGREAVRLGGCPLAEHGVGRNSVKQALLRQLYGPAGITQMRAVKRVLDPGWKLAPGVIFTPD